MGELVDRVTVPVEAGELHLMFDTQSRNSSDYSLESAGLFAPGKGGVGHTRRPSRVPLAEVDPLDLALDDVAHFAAGVLRDGTPQLPSVCASVQQALTGRFRVENGILIDALLTRVTVREKCPRNMA